MPAKRDGLAAVVEPGRRRPAAKTVGSSVNGRSRGGGGQVRIIGGDLKRSIVTVAPVEGLRPSPDRVRETLFNWLGQDLGGWAILDAFAGTGVLGLESLSRGADHVDFCETHARARQQLQANCDVLLPRLDRQVRVNISGQDVTQFVRQQAASGCIRYDLALLDPPFRSDWLQKCLPVVLSCMRDTGLIYIEWHAGLRDDVGVFSMLSDAGWHVHREQQAGQVHFHLLGRP